MTFGTITDETAIPTIYETEFDFSSRTETADNPYLIYTENDTTILQLKDDMRLGRTEVQDQILDKLRDDDKPLQIDLDGVHTLPSNVVALLLKLKKLHPDSALPLRNVTPALRQVLELLKIIDERILRIIEEDDTVAMKSDETVVSDQSTAPIEYTALRPDDSSTVCTMTRVQVGNTVIEIEYAKDKKATVSMASIGQVLSSHTAQGIAWALSDIVKSGTVKQLTIDCSGITFAKENLPQVLRLVAEKCAAANCTLRLSHVSPALKESFGDALSHFTIIDDE